MVRPLVAADGPEPAFFVDAFRAVDLEVGRRAGTRFVEVRLADDFFGEAFFADFDLGGGLA